jgi:hypothetical protein
MNRTDGNDGTPRQQLPEAHSAVYRLEDMKEHRASLMEDIRHHWPGWLGSLAFHASLLVLFMLIVWPIVRDQEKEVTIGPPMDAAEELSTQTLESILPTLYESRFDVPQFADDTPRPSTDLTELTPGVRYLGPEGPYGKFVFDSTGSMGGILLEVKTRMRTLIHAMNYFVPGRARLGLVTYRDLKKYDFDEYDYTVRYEPMVRCDAEGLEKLHAFLRKTEAYGGVDIPEAVYEGIETAVTRMKWRPGSAKVIIVFGDAPPRPENGGVDRIVKYCRRWHDRTGGVITCIDTSGDRDLKQEFKAMAAAGGGQAVSLNAEREIIRKLVVSMFDPEYQKAVGVSFDKFVDDEGRDVLRSD